MKKVLSFLLCYLAVNLSFGQQDKQFTHYMFDRMSFNPAATGFKGYCGTVIYRNQWDRVERAPNSTLLNVQGNLQKYSTGVGMSFMNEAIGFQRNTSVTLNGAYHFRTVYGVLSGGLGLGIINVGFSPNWIPPQTEPSQDLALPMQTGATGFDVNLGLYWHGTTAPYYVGVSTTHLTSPDLKNVNYNVARHYYVIAGYNVALSELLGLGTKIDLKPSTLIKADGAGMIFDLNIMGDFWLNNYSFLWGGFTYRLSDAVALQLGYAFSPTSSMKQNVMKIGYSFDIMTNAMDEYGKGTHEIMLNYCMFPPPPAVPRHGNPFILQ
ncbi:MAG: PorP/SprF family type IX secretion system membrane protein [Crocinitomicaceae bacterium]